MPVVSLLRSSRESLASESPNHEKQLEIFSNFWVLVIFVTWSWVEAPVASLHRRFRNSLTSGSPSREKGLNKIFKKNFKGFWQLVLATCLQVNWVTKIACFARIGLNLRQFSKTFQFFLASRAHTLSCPPLPLPKPPFSSSILHQSSRKGIGYLLFSLYFKFLALVFLDLCLCWDMRIWLLNMEIWCFDEYDICFVGFVSIMLILHVLLVCSSFLCIVLYFVLCCAYHVHDKMSLSCFCVSLWIPLGTWFVGIIMFLWL